MNSSAQHDKFLQELTKRRAKRVSAMPLYWQAAESLRETINRFGLPTGVPLPAEKEMAEALGVSRPTLRQAIAQLARDGFVHTQRGVGTFALPPSLVRPPGFASLFSDLAAQNRHPRSIVLTLDELDASDEVIDGLHLAPRSRVTRVERVRLADERPVAFILNYLSLPPGSTLDRKQLETSSLYRVLHQEFSIELVKGSQGVVARTATDRESELLRLKRKSAVLVMKRWTFDSHGHGIEHSQTVYPEGTEVKTADLRP